MAENDVSLTPLSLYLDLEAGTSADLDVVAKAALAWSAAIKEIAYVVDPGIQVRLELESGTPGSLSLNARLKSIGPAVKQAGAQVRAVLSEPQTVRTIIITGAMWLVMNTAEYTFERVMDFLTGADAPPEAQALSDEDKADVARRVVEALRNESAKRPARTVFRELERDSKIVGAGLTTKAGKRPDQIVPRADFPRMAGRVEVRTETLTKRTVPERMRVTLVRPILERSDRRWGFRGAAGEFGASIKHPEFIESVLSGTTAVPMMEGIEMTIDLETVEKFEGGVWVPIEREVVNVVDLHQPMKQAALFPPP
ncbi:MAG: hypothetical protein Q8S03_18305 [Brevundimonas sp.]|uniref:hypothetical protein n=1 Tax=Brevundimonas sp. TaxID=1871086 RepID=UPI0027368BC4|nr:hypothetical protein [Brevundimonas sp.]MDP3406647.1 hypothetical protein [Brevundimonas sp.]